MMDANRAPERVAVTGAGGFIGRAVVEELRHRGFAPIALGRSPDSLRFDDGVERRRFDPNDAALNPQAFEGAHAVVHLAGESVAGRWTQAKKRAIAASRIEGTRTVVASLAACRDRPSVLVSASGTGYYGARGDEPLDENATNGTDFLAEVCAGWEREAAAAATLGVRVVRLRTGIVLGAGGALPRMALPFRFGIGGPLGSGRQFVPWIHLDDVAALYATCVERADLCGPVNAVAPDEATNARFARAIGAALRRPAFIPTPPLALRLALGEFAESVLTGQRVLPAAAIAAGFTWSHPVLEAAIRAALT